jgi:hypothetical protein
MLSTRRQPGERRWGLDVEFPLRDSRGYFVIADRRKTPDRRLLVATMEDWARLVSKSRRQDD